MIRAWQFAKKSSKLVSGYEVKSETGPYKNFSSSFQIVSPHLSSRLLSVGPAANHKLAADLQLPAQQIKYTTELLAKG